MFYSIYSVPNIILPLVGGYLIDNCGVRMNIVLFSSLLILGYKMRIFNSEKLDNIHSSYNGKEFHFSVIW